MPNESTKKGLIFSSYNRKDLEVVQMISSRLRHQGIDLWLDTQNLLAGSEWLTELEVVILKSRAAVIFKGPHGFGNFQREEISALFKLHADQKLLLIPALLPGASGKDAGLFLGNIHHVDFRLRNPDPFGELLSGLAQNAPAKIALMQSSVQQPEVAHPLVQWIVNDMTNLKDMEYLRPPLYRSKALGGSALHLLSACPACHRPVQSPLCRQLSADRQDPFSCRAARPGRKEVGNRSSRLPGLFPSRLNEGRKAD